MNVKNGSKAASPIFIGRWIVSILFALHETFHRHGQLQRRLRWASQRTLTRTLRNLESTGLEHRAIAAGRNIYAVTAPIVVEAARRILADDRRVGGTATPGEIFDAEDFLRALSPEHISLELAHSKAR